MKANNMIVTWENQHFICDIYADIIDYIEDVTWVLMFYWIY